MLDIHSPAPMVLFIAPPMIACAWSRTLAEDKDTRQRYVSSKRTCAMDETAQRRSHRGRSLRRCSFARLASVPQAQRQTTVMDDTRASSEVVGALPLPRGWSTLGAAPSGCRTGRRAAGRAWTALVLLCATRGRRVRVSVRISAPGATILQPRHGPGLQGPHFTASAVIRPTCSSSSVQLSPPSSLWSSVPSPRPAKSRPSPVASA